MHVVITNTITIVILLLLKQIPFYYHMPICVPFRSIFTVCKVLYESYTPLWSRESHYRYRSGCEVKGHILVYTVNYITV